MIKNILKIKKAIKINKKFIYIFFVILVFVFNNKIYADATDKVNYDLTTELNETEITELNNFDTLANFVWLHFSIRLNL